MGSNLRRDAIVELITKEHIGSQAVLSELPTTEVAGFRY